MAIRLDGLQSYPVETNSAREWLVTNGLGGYAAGTLSGIATRRYHGLLVVATTPPRGRMVLLSHLDETVVEAEGSAELSAHAFPKVVHPDGWRRLRTFTQAPFPTWEYAVDGGVLRRELVMLDATHTVVLRYTLEAPRARGLLLRPFGVWRDFHHHAKVNAEARIEALLREGVSGEIVMAPYLEAPSVTLRVPGVFQSAPSWWRDFEHSEERGRGLDAHEDAFTPGVFFCTLQPYETLEVVISADETVPREIEALIEVSRTRLEELLPERALPPAIAQLYLAVDAYRIDHASPPALLAGYPWFEDWGRDTLIAFTGCYLVPGRYEEARRLLSAFAAYVDQGMLPNRFPDGGAGHADYNTVDAPLWFFYAVRRYLQYTGDEAFVLTALLPALEAIANGFLNGTRYNIHVNAEGLVEAGDPSTQLTWMDARVGDWVVTSRHGAPVEINALWHSGLLTLSALCARAHDAVGAGRYAHEAQRAAAAFRTRFWHAERGYLYDVVRGAAGDPSVRPNALYAVSLPGELLSVRQCESVLKVCRDELLVPLALRTLSPRDAGYRGWYSGDPWSRDGAYHQGTAWPFLFGAYVSAVMATARRVSEAEVARARAELKALYRPLDAALRAYGLGHLSEIVEGDEPHRPVGCFAQAWSDAELLRGWVEEVDADGRFDQLPSSPR
ncbi:MAG: glycogen debranching enzyme family protein [Myxococcales bacterium]|nr:glycogen debranching enzyme family protein [Myxococcales bacterium]